MISRDLLCCLWQFSSLMTSRYTYHVTTIQLQIIRKQWFDNLSVSIPPSTSGSPVNTRLSLILYDSMDRRGSDMSRCLFYNKYIRVLYSERRRLNSFTLQSTWWIYPLEGNWRISAIMSPCSSSFFHCFINNNLYGIEYLLFKLFCPSRRSHVSV